MAFQRVPETAELSIHCVSDDQAIINTFYYRKVGGYTNTELNELAGGAGAVISGEFKPLWGVGTQYQFVQVRGLDAENDYVLTDNTGAGAGTLSGALLPNNVAFAIQRTSHLTGRSARGRIFWGGMTENALDGSGNHVTIGYAESVVAAIVDLDLVAVGFGWNPVIVSRYTGSAKRAEGVTFPLEDWRAIDLAIDSQRKRLPKL